MADKNKGLGREFFKGIIKENPVLVMLLGMCPTLAVTTQAVNGIGMGLATTFVLLGSNIVVSLLRNVIPDKVRIPSFIVIIASFVTLIGFLLEGFVPSLYDSLGIYLTLITVNCIIFGRAEMFASKNKVLPSILDALGMGLGFTLALFLMGSIREIIGSGQWMGFTIPGISSNPMLIFIMPAGGFFVLGVIIAAVNKLANRKPPAELGCGGCEGCPNASKCGGNGGNEE
ncbi:MAG: electron transport complex subunit E [Ruminococcus sp.]|nr:electron transport complex subunit E [Ruminococcus sp.]